MGSSKLSRCLILVCVQGIKTNSWNVKAGSNLLKVTQEGGEVSHKVRSMRPRGTCWLLLSPDKVERAQTQKAKKVKAFLRSHS